MTIVGSDAPHDDAARLADPVPLRRAAVHPGALGVRVPAADLAIPALAEAGHVGVVERHLGVDAGIFQPFAAAARTFPALRRR